MTPEESKAVAKEAFKEWLDEQFTSFGKWSARVIAVAVLVIIFYAFVSLRTNGFTDLPKVSVH